MKKLFNFKSLINIALMALLLSVPACYDDTEFRDRLAEYETRLQALERLCSELNTNIASVQQIISALQNNEVVTAVTPVTENGRQIGYTITFSKSGSVTIYHGKDGSDGQDGKDGVDGQDGKDGVDGQDGKDGSTPVVGLRQDGDGIWYWTLNDDWLVDSAGNKIKAIGVDGQDGTNGTNGLDGVTPQMKIVTGSWYISYDSGTTWTLLGQATGNDGTNGTNGTDGTSFFSSVTYDAASVTLTLANSTVITLPRARQLTVVFDAPYNSLDTIPVTMTGSPVNLSLPYTVTSSLETRVEVIGSTDIETRIENVVKTPPASEGDPYTQTGQVTVSIPGTIVDFSFTKVTIFFSDDKTLLMRTFYFKAV